MGFNILLLDMLELVNLGGYSCEGEEMKVSADMGKKKKQIRQYILGIRVGNAVEL